MIYFFLVDDLIGGIPDTHENENSDRNLSSFLFAPARVLGPWKDGIGELFVDHGMVFSFLTFRETLGLDGIWFLFASSPDPELLRSPFRLWRDQKSEHTRSGNQPWILRSGTYCVENTNIIYYDECRLMALLHGCQYLDV